VNIKVPNDSVTIVNANQTFKLEASNVITYTDSRPVQGCEIPPGYAHWSYLHDLIHDLQCQILDLKMQIEESKR
jgi:hypothetical protein